MIVQDGLRSPQLPPWMMELPFELLWDVQRVLQTNRISIDELAEAWQSPRDVESLLEVLCLRKIPFEASDKVPLTDATFIANLRWSWSTRGPVFYLQLLPLRKDKANSFERKFGRCRFFVLNVPSLLNPPDATGLSKFRYDIAMQVRELYKHDQTLLGRVWHYFLVQARDARPNDPDFSAPGGTQVYFFAERSEAHSELLPFVKHEDVINWWILFAQNQKTTGRKAYTRLDLGVSRTRPTEAIDVNEIEYGVADKESTHDPDSNEFDDPKLPNPMLKSDEAMDDGCNRVSIRIMRGVQDAFDLPYLPSVVQARIAGAKGLWFLDEDEEADIWIQGVEKATPKKAITIGKSQVKVWHDTESLMDLEKRTLNVNDFNRTPQPAIMYSSFLPILVDRNVPLQSIAKLAKRGMDAILQALEEALHDGEKMQHWIHTNIKSTSSLDSETSDRIDDAFPFISEDRIIRMLRSGYEIATCKHLAKCVLKVVKLYIKHLHEKIKIPLPKSTMLYGICDPLGVLEPGTMHVGFRNAFDDGDRQLNSLKGRQALIGRLPALGRTDMQRVRCVYDPRLAHLTGVVVLPARGPRSLASKLQGGDYDGDKFVITWDPALVGPFQNAPVQAVAKGPKYFGIAVNEKTLSDIVPTDEQGNFQDKDVAAWLDDNVGEVLGFNWVGIVTDTFDAVVYNAGGLGSDATEELQQLHDHILDAPKKGYSFDWAAWDRFRRKHNLKNLEKPAYKRYFKGEDISNVKWKDDNVIDHVLFRVVEPVLQSALQQAVDLEEKAPTKDDQLRAVFSSTRKSYARGSVGRNELESLVEKLGELKRQWDVGTKEYHRRTTDKTRHWRELIEKTRQHFLAIMPDDVDAETPKAWLDRNGEAPRMWDLLKASALCVMDVSPSLMFEAAGHELCEIKARAVFGAQSIRPNMLRALKPRPLKRKAEAELDARAGDGLMLRDELEHATE